MATDETGNGKRIDWDAVFVGRQKLMKNGWICEEWKEFSTGHLACILNGYVRGFINRFQAEAECTPIPTKREGWVNVYPITTIHKQVSDNGKGRSAALSNAFESRALADEVSNFDRVACVRIEWEEP